MLTADIMDNLNGLDLLQTVFDDISLKLNEGLHEASAYPIDRE